MNSNICYNCGFSHDGDQNCPACGAVTENVSPKEQKRLSAAFALLRESQFEEAKTAFEATLKKYPENALAYWGRLRARYHIVYVTVADGKSAPKCPTKSGANIFEDADYLKATEYADENTKAFLQEQAERIKISCTEIVSTKNIVNRFTFGEVDPNDAFIVKPKKSKKPIVLSAALSLALIAALSVCFAMGVFHKHTPGAEATCTENQICIKCNEVLAFALGHQPGDWKTEVIPSSEQDGLRVRRCEICHEIAIQKSLRVSKGLRFVSNSDGTYSVQGIGTCADTEIVIPKEYHGPSLLKLKFLQKQYLFLIFHYH